MVLMTTHYSMLRVLLPYPHCRMAHLFPTGHPFFFFLSLHLVTKSYTTSLLFFSINLFIFVYDFWLCWVLVAAHRLL